MNAGFVPALGTPLDANGNLCVESYRKQIEDQISAGAIALLCMGSMGIQAYLKNEVCYPTAKTAVEAAAGRVPVYVGVMDCSIARVAARMKELEALPLDGFVLTAPFYSPATPQQIINFYRGVCAATNHKVLMYDLVGVTQSKITLDIIKELIRTVPNIGGIKTGDLNMVRKMILDPEIPEEFRIFYSGLDSFDVAYKWGVEKCLDGMPTCTPANTGKMFAAMKQGDYDTAAVCLNNILALRDFFFTKDLMPAYSAAMNMLGYEGMHAPDICSPLPEAALPEIRAELIRIGELEA